MDRKLDEFASSPIAHDITVYIFAIFQYCVPKFVTDKTFPVLSSSFKSLRKASVTFSTLKR